VRDDVWIKNLERKGSLTVGFGHEPDRFGPELEFGHTVGDHFAEQVLLIKTCWGGHLLPLEFRPPSSGLAPPQFLARLRQDLQREKADPTPAEVEQRCGATYREMVREIRETLANVGGHFPAYRGQGVEIAGFVWFQGFSDMLTPNYTPDYAELLANLIRDVRRDLHAPQLPCVIGQFGVHVPVTKNKAEQLRADLEAVAQLPEFAGNVKLVETEPFWDHEADAVFKKGWQAYREQWDSVGSDLPYHYLGSAKTTCQIGRAFGEAMLELRRSAAEN
jgi:alpha-galactosidase